MWGRAFRSAPTSSPSRTDSSSTYCRRRSAGRSGPSESSSDGRASSRTMRWRRNPGRCWPKTPARWRPSHRWRRASRPAPRARTMPVARAEPLPVDGVCDGRFAAVRDAFVTNFTERGDVGAAVTVSVGGQVVVDLWGGFADAAHRRPWRRDTLVNFFSVSKGLSTVCVLQLVERGLLDLDAEVVRYWPGFGGA